MAPVPDLIYNPVVFTGCLLVALGALTAILASATTIWRNVRRQPSVDEIFATKSELAALEKSSQERWHACREEFAAVERRITHDMGESRASHRDELGALERRLTHDMSEAHTANERRFTELAVKMDGLVGTVQKLSNDMMRALGRLEGKADEPK